MEPSKISKELCEKYSDLLTKKQPQIFDQVNYHWLLFNYFPDIVKVTIRFNPIKIIVRLDT